MLSVDALPLTVNGKLDRKILTERAAMPSGGAGLYPYAAPPRGATSPNAPADKNSAVTALIEIFTQTLPGTAVDADTDFFHAGGDSIVAITVVNRARTLGLQISPRDVFLFKTPRALADNLATSTPQTASPAPARREDGPLTPTPIILRQRELGGSLTRFAQARTLQAPEGTAFTDAQRAANAVVAPTRPCACACAPRTAYGPCAPKRPTKSPSYDRTPPTPRPWRTTLPHSSTPSPETSSPSPGWKPPAPSWSPCTTSPSTRSPG
ncbi:hypothetical protein GCM10011428_78280 [Streptomyces violaceus]